MGTLHLMEPVPDPAALHAASVVARNLGRAEGLDWARGRTNQVWAAGDLLLRVAPEDVDVDALQPRLVRAAAVGFAGGGVVAPWTRDVFEVDGRCVTVWPRVEAARPPTWVDVAEALAQLHAPGVLEEAERFLAERPVDLPAWTLGGALEETSMGDPAVEALKATVLDRSRILLPLLEASPEVVLHHDAKRVNVIVTSTGPLLVDLDELQRGPLLVDLGILAEKLAGLDEDALRSAHPFLAALEGPLVTNPELRAGRLARQLHYAAWLGRRGDVAAAGNVLEHVLAEVARFEQGRVQGR